MVATETLAVGVNYPSDVVIVVDREIPSDGDFRALSGPDTNNIIGALRHPKEYIWHLSIR